ncbi:MurR/RpiR family transcriptional regulator [Pelagibius sp.]|uniref:MurR/RpiR family transcriptional regulator n=1 Tax=Pelagibius sp. TaxID=1931238 RepID=UPI002624BC1A|nr:MurR/RpiR family transcriptional regulator [Pelagibius sp.]
MSAELQKLIAAHASRLTTADSRLLDVLLQDPLRAAMDTGKDISDRANVHPAAAVRLAKRLGFPGYPEFRAFLRENLTAGEDDFRSPAARVMARLARSEESSSLSAVIESEMSALAGLREALADGEIAAAATEIAKARQLYVYGRGHAASLSSLVSRRLRRSGYPVIDIGSHITGPAELLINLGPEDLLVLFAFREPTARLQELLTTARDIGTRVLAITDVGGGRLDPKPDLHISAPRGAAGESQSLVVPMTITNAIILELAATDDGRSLAALARYDELKKRFAR